MKYITLSYLLILIVSSNCLAQKNETEKIKILTLESNAQNYSQNEAFFSKNRRIKKEGGEPLSATNSIPESDSLCADPNGDRVASLGDYLITTNTWGKGAIKSFKNCVSGSILESVVERVAIQTGVTANIDWNWPDNSFSVKAYPEIIYRPNGRAMQPIRFDTVGGLTVSHDVTLSAAGDYNVAYDIWIDASSKKRQWPHKAEIMIKVMGTWTDTPVVDTVFLEGVQYDVIVGLGGEGKWKFIVFQAKNMMLKGSIPIRPMISYLVAKQHLLITDYISTIEFGMELMRGQGKATINSFNVIR